MRRKVYPEGRERSGVKWMRLKVSAKPIREYEVLEKD